jgi:protein TonB
VTPALRHWSFAGITAISLHSALLFATAWHPTQPGARAPGTGGIEISLGATGGAPGSVAQSAASATATEVPPDTAPQTEVAPAQPGVPPAERAGAPDPSDAKTETVPVVDDVAVAPPPVADAASAMPVAAVDVPEPRRKPAPPARPRPPETATTLPAPAPPVEFATVSPEAAKPVALPAPPAPAVPDAARAAVSTPAGAGGQSGQQNSRNAGSGTQASAGGRVGTPPEYMDVIRAWLDRHKEYPRPARTRREEGVAYLYFVIDRAGKVLDYRLRQTSGFGSLDRAAVEMIQRADPLPRMPDSIARAHLELVVPVEFQLR